jgi:hypothetical protein
VRVPPEIEQLMKEGASLSVDDAAALERILDLRPQDLDTRARLLGYERARAWAAHAATTPEEKLAQGMDVFFSRVSDLEKIRARHALWLAENAPRAPLAAHPLCHFQMTKSPYAELSSIWRRHVAAEPADPTLLAHAISFFWDANEQFADELVARAEVLFPGDMRWIRFRQERRADELHREHRLQPFRDSRLIPAGEEGSTGDDRRAQKRLAEMEALLRESDPEAAWLFRLRRIAADLSLALGDLHRARAHAEQLLVSGPDELRLGDPVHDGHLLLGRIALREDDVDRARAHLILAGEAGGKGLFAFFGPNLRLAIDLLARGESEVVIRYLTLCRAFWERAPIDEWIAAIRAGESPNFGERTD